jgi:5-methyltetrahydrofolate--homocysteine methyltransferase
MTDYAVMNQHLFEGNLQQVKGATEAALAEGRPVLEVLNEGLIAGMAVIGEDFKHNRVFVPEVLLAARAMKAGLAVIQPLLVGDGTPQKAAKVIVMGTVKGDLHDIGKNLVGMLAEGAGFQIVDLGTNTSARSFIEAVEAHDAAILGMSALLTTTMVYMKTVVDEVRAAGLEIRICVGGAPLSQEFANEIGADGYAADASSAVELFKRLTAGPERAATGSSKAISAP